MLILCALLSGSLQGLCVQIIEDTSFALKVNRFSVSLCRNVRCQVPAMAELVHMAC